MPLSWTQITTYPTPERGSYNFEVDSAGNLFVLAGWDDTSFDFTGMSRVDKYDAAAGTWGTVAALPSPTRDSAASAIDSQDRIYIIAGALTGEPTNVRDVDRYDPATDTWTARADLPVTKLNAAAVADSQDRIYIAGGYSGGVTRTVYRYDPSTNAWSKLPDMPSPGRDSHAMAVDDQDRVYVMGGFGPSGRIRQVDRYDPGTNSWTTIAQLPTPARDNSGGATDKFGRIYVVGGTEATNADGIGQVDRFDPFLNAWESLARITDWDNQTSAFAFAGVDSQERIWALSSAQVTERAIYRAVANEAPNAPTLEHPIENTVIDGTEQNTYQWDFNDPDPEDTQSQYRIRWRLVGASNWTEVFDNNSNTVRVIAADSLADGDYEWQARTSDSLGNQGPWSASEFFTVGSPPAEPTITDPTLDQVIGTNTYQVAWTSGDQDTYQVRKVADDGTGVADESTVLYDSGAIASTSTVHETPFPVNGRTEHIQVRVRFNTIWSSWDSVRVSVDYTTPAEPTITLTPSNELGRILIEIDHPVPSGNEPNVTSQDLLRRRVGETEWTVLAKGQDPETSYEDYAVVSEQAYEYAVLSYGDNDTNATSAPASTNGIVIKGSWLHRVSDPAGTAYNFRYNTSGGVDQWEPDVTFSRYAGRTFPVAEFGEHETNQVSVDLQLDTDDEVQAFIDLVKAKEILCYRDSAKRKVFGIATVLNRAHTFYGGTAPLQIQEIDFTEDVS